MSYLIIFCLLSLLILIHELGHFVAAKFLGIPIARFSVGFGPRLWGFTIRNTEYRLSAFPCGGYVLPAFDDVAALHALPLHKRILFSLGGPIANFLAAFVCLAWFSTSQLGPSLHSLLPLEQFIDATAHILAAIPALFSHPDQLSGIVGIVAAGGHHVGLSFLRLLQFSVLLNLNLAIFNLLPFPPLDGGKILLSLLQKIYRPLIKLEIPLTIGGVALLLVLTLATTVLDLTRLLGT